ncbi:hypothetical protein [Haloferax volcanii]
MTNDDGDEDAKKSSFMTDEKARIAETSEEDPRDEQSEEESG